jgi:hypothetical protein
VPLSVKVVNTAPANEPSTALEVALRPRLAENRLARILPFALARPVADTREHPDAARSADGERLLRRRPLRSVAVSGTRTLWGESNGYEYIRSRLSHRGD